MARPKILDTAYEGTAEELEIYLKQHPNERFRLVRVALPTLPGTEPKTLSSEQEIEKFRKQGLRGVGLFAYVPGGSEEFAKQKQEEIEREDRTRP